MIHSDSQISNSSQSYLHHQHSTKAFFVHIVGGYPIQHHCQHDFSKSTVIIIIITIIARVVFPPSFHSTNKSEA